MNAHIEPSPKRGTGCFGKGCLILVILAIFLVVVGVGGSYWSVRHVYLSDKPVPIPEPSAAPETSAVTPSVTSMATPPPPTEKSAEVRERLDTMKQAARAHEPNEVILTAADINALIAANKKSSGMASVGINGNVAQVLVSIPMQKLHVPLRDALGLGDRYLNASISIVAPPGTNASNVQLSEVTINGHSVPPNFLDGGFLGVGSLRSYVVHYANQYGVTDMEIRDGKVILHTSGN